jgi:hypothetical protein
MEQVLEQSWNKYRNLMELYGTFWNCYQRETPLFRGVPVIPLETTPYFITD